MSTYKHIDRICALGVVLALVICGLFMNAEALGIQEKTQVIGYENKLFDTSRVHTLDIVMDDWDTFLTTATSEVYSMCTVVIDGEAYSRVGIRGKGNTSLSSVSASGSSRYSFKIEFDQYEDNKSYHGLDKLCLNNLIQDATMMKDYMAYRLMYEFGADSPLCSFVWVTVNGEDWGLYLAVEAIEDSFLQRNYGYNHGELYKPDTLNQNAGDGVDIGTSGDANLRYIDDNPDSYVAIFSSAKTEPTQEDKERLVASLKTLNESVYGEVENALYVDEVLRYFVVHSYVVNGDSYTGNIIHNYYLYEGEGKFAMIPWDYNLGYGTFMSGDGNETINDDIDNPMGVVGKDRPMVDWIYDHEEYTELYHQYYQEFIDTVDIMGIFYEAVELITPYVEKDPTSFVSYEEFLSGTAAMESFFLLRTEAVSNQLAGNGKQVDASSLNISAMGGMGGVGGGMGDSGGGEDQGSGGNENQDQNQDSMGGENQDQNQGNQGDQNADSSAGGETTDPNASTPAAPDASTPDASQPAGDSAGSENGEAMPAAATAVSTSAKLDTTSTTMPAEDSSAGGETMPSDPAATDPNASQPAGDSAGAETTPSDPAASTPAADDSAGSEGSETMPSDPAASTPATGDSGGGEAAPNDPAASTPATDGSAGGDSAGGETTPADPNASQPAGDQNNGSAGGDSAGGEGGEANPAPGETQAQTGTTTTPTPEESKELFTVSVLVMLLGLAFAILFKR